MLLCCLVNAQGTQQFVDRQSGFTQNLGQFAVHDAAVELELPATLLRMGKAQRKRSVGHGIALNMHHTCTVARHLDGGLQTLQTQRTFVLRLCSHQVHTDSAQHHQQQGQQAPRSPE